MLNYRVDLALLAPLVPRGTVLDTWQGATYVSVVGFLFRHTRVLGLPVPFHRNFEEVNLRFYVRRDDARGVRRGVVFVKEIVPRRAIAAVARLAYNEPYVARPMRHSLEVDDAGLPSRAAYSWRQSGAWCRLAVETSGAATAIAQGSEAEFITEHYWGYTRQRDGGTVEYSVLHPRWNVWQARAASLDGDMSAVYGEAFGAVLGRQPDSAFLADGSAIVVGMPRHII